MKDEIHVKVTKYTDRTNWVMYYHDPVTEKMVTKSSGEPTQRGAEREAGKWEADLRSGRNRHNSRMTWEAFRDKYELEKLPSLAEKTRAAARSAMNHLERVIDPKKLRSVNSATISRLQADLRKEGMKDTTIATHLRHLRSALSWAVKMEILPEVPEMHMPKRAKGQKIMRGRPIAGEEFDRMIEKVPEIRPHDAKTWERYLRGLWLSGLRLGESLALSWDGDAAFAVDLSGKHPRFRIYAEAEKGHQDRLLPMTPDFAGRLLETPKEERHGRVFRLNSRHTGRPLADNRVTRIISDIGQAAGVVVNRETKLVKEKVRKKADGKWRKVPTGRMVEVELIKYASAHDLRRAFGTRWAPRLKPATLQRLMRHSDIETTMRYYVHLDADDMAAELWRDFGNINTSINSAPNATSDSGNG